MLVPFHISFKSGRLYKKTEKSIHRSNITSQKSYKGKYSRKCQNKHQNTTCAPVSHSQLGIIEYTLLKEDTLLKDK